MSDESIRDRWLAAKAELVRLEALDEDIDLHPDVSAAFAAIGGAERDSAEEGRLAAVYNAVALRAQTEVTQLLDAQKELCDALTLDLLSCPEEIEFTLRDSDSGVTKRIMAATEKEALAEAREWAREGDYGEIESTIWVDVYVSQETDRGYDPERGSDEETCVTVAIDPDEPDCAEGHEHDWRAPYSVLGGLEENPGVWGHGGGVICKRVCAHCGAYRVTDSWAQNPENGEQGLDSVRYEDADDDSLAWVASRKLEAAIKALNDDGYDTDDDDDHTFIRGLAPDSADPAYECDGERPHERTAPGSKWDEDCDRLLAGVRAIVEPHGCTADWSDDDMRIEVA